MRRSLALTLCILFLAAVPALAVPVTAINSATLASLLGTPWGPALTSAYTFESPGAVPGGFVWSQAYAGTGAATGFNVYLYQVTSAGAPDVNSIGFSFRAPEFVGPYQAFSIAPAVPAVPPLIPPSGASWSPTLGGAYNFGFEVALVGGTASYQFGVFSPHRPGLVNANLIDGGLVLDKPRPQVWSAVPEPGIVSLLGLGLASLGFGGLLRRKTVVRGER